MRATFATTAATIGIAFISVIHAFDNHAIRFVNDREWPRRAGWEDSLWGKIMIDMEKLT